MREVEVAALTFDVAVQSPVVILKEIGGERTVPIYIGDAEAQAIGRILEGIRIERPQTHDLFIQIIDKMEAHMKRAVIHDIKEGTYFAVLNLESGDTHYRIDSRPSDAIAIALRAEAPIFVEEGVLFTDDSGEGAESLKPRSISDFLKKLRPEDFGEFTME